MSQNIASKLAAAVITVVMNVIIFGGVSYLFDSQSYAASTFAQFQCDSKDLQRTSA